MSRAILSLEDFGMLVGSGGAGVTASGAGQAVVNADNVDGSVTYNEGNGVPDTIVMTGPLSEVYTKALGVYFKKEPLDTVSVESQAMDSALISSVVDSKVEAGLKEVASAVGLKTPGNYNDEVVSATVLAVDQTMMNRPEVIDSLEKIRDKASRDGTDYVMVVNIEPLEKINEVFMGSNKTVVGLNSGEINSETVGKSFSRATECYCAQQGMNVVFGFEGFALWATDHAKKVKSKQSLNNHNKD